MLKRRRRGQRGEERCSPESVPPPPPRRHGLSAARPAADMGPLLALLLLLLLSRAAPAPRARPLPGLLGEWGEVWGGGGAVSRGVSCEGGGRGFSASEGVWEWGKWRLSEGGGEGGGCSVSHGAGGGGCSATEGACRRVGAGGRGLVGE